MGKPTTFLALDSDLTAFLGPGHTATSTLGGPGIIYLRDPPAVLTHYGIDPRPSIGANTLLVTSRPGLQGHQAGLSGWLRVGRDPNRNRPTIRRSQTFRRPARPNALGAPT